MKLLLRIFCGILGLALLITLLIIAAPVLGFIFLLFVALVLLIAAIDG